MLFCSPHPSPLLASAVKWRELSSWTRGKQIAMRRVTQTQTPSLRLLRCHVWIKRSEINVRTEFTMGDETQDEMNARYCSVDDFEIQTCPCPLPLLTHIKIS